MSDSKIRERRGEPRVLPDDLVVPVRPLSDDERRVFDETVRSRPGFWTFADLPLLTMYARAVVRYFDYEENTDPPPSVNGLVRLAGIVNQMAKTLRVSPFSRAEVGKPVGAPPSAGHADTAVQEAKFFAPWARREDDERRIAGPHDA